MKRSHAKYEIFPDKAGEWRFRLRAANGRIVAQSEAYPSKWHAERGVDALARTARDAAVYGSVREVTR